MDDLISRQAAIDVLATMQGLCTSKTALVQNSKIWQQIKDLPSAERRGRWIDKDGGIATCSECGERWGVWSVMNYCPNCGARMDGEQDG